MDGLIDSDFINLKKCPWCESDILQSSFLYRALDGVDVRKCLKCGVVYAGKRLNESGLNKYWRDYLSRVHITDKEMENKRKQMYKIDFDYIFEFVKKGKVLDVGCGNGSFMNLFKKRGFNVYGVEFGQEAANISAKEHKVKQGDFSKMSFMNKFDLIIFRGVLQYVPNSKEYIDKAIQLLNNDGYIFITAQPNMDSLCFKVFREHFNNAINSSDFIGYTEKLFTKYFNTKNMVLAGKSYFYENTPYADVEHDILKVAKAISMVQGGKKIDFQSPAFYENMMSLVYRKM